MPLMPCQSFLNGSHAVPVQTSNWRVWEDGVTAMGPCGLSGVGGNTPSSNIHIHFSPHLMHNVHCIQFEE